MGYNSFLRSPKMEEQQVPDEDSNLTKFANTTKLDGCINKDEVDVMDDLEHILGIDDDDDDDDDEIYLPKNNKNINYGTGHQLSWGFNNWDDQFSYNYGEDLEEEEVEEDIKEHKCFYEENKYCNKVIKKEIAGFCDTEDELKVSHLKLNLNYQEVLDAWSNRGSLWANDYSLSASTSGYYMGEVPVLIEEERTRREASVMRYKEKRQNRLFSKKIRYQVRKLNADKRPRLKGRFVKRIS